MLIESPLLSSAGLALDPALHFVEGDAEDLGGTAGIADASLDGYTIAFGIRNVTRVERALREAHRVLRPGGRFLCLELSHVEPRLLQPLWDGGRGGGRRAEVQGEAFGSPRRKKKTGD